MSFQDREKNDDLFEGPPLEGSEEGCDGIDWSDMVEDGDSIDIDEGLENFELEAEIADPEGESLLGQEEAAEIPWDEEAFFEPGESWIGEQGEVDIPIENLDEGEWIGDNGDEEGIENEVIEDLSNHLPPLDDQFPESEEE
ncbi:MAG: hypothetical protein RMJ84_00115 [Sandaracinaceae bacterium]|nr:hypothetical protein [Sandaracinaceae bacterium]